MLVDPGFARRVLGDGTPDGFAQAEAQMLRRTNGWRVRGRRPWADVPWPRWWGTSPWGAAAELERGTGRRYGFTLLRPLGGSDVERVLAAAPRPDAPALCYVGSRLLPRHVVLLVRDPEGDALVYEPSRGSVTRLGDSASAPTSPWGGWRTAWWVVGARDT